MCIAYWRRLQEQKIHKDVQELDLNCATQTNTCAFTRVHVLFAADLDLRESLLYIVSVGSIVTVL